MTILFGSTIDLYNYLAKWVQGSNDIINYYFCLFVCGQANLSNFSSLNIMLVSPQSLNVCLASLHRSYTKLALSLTQTIFTPLSHLVLVDFFVVSSIRRRSSAHLRCFPFPLFFDLSSQFYDFHHPLPMQLLVLHCLTTFNVSIFLLLI